MSWVLYLLVASSVVGKADATRKWVMPSQAACQAAVSGSRVVALPPSITIAVDRATSVEANAQAPATAVLVCVQEKT